MPEPKIILFDRKEKTATKQGEYLVIHSLDGTSHRIKDSRKQLWDLFDDVHRWQPFLFIYDEYKNIPYVKDVTDIKDVILTRAIIGMARKVIEATDNERVRSQAVSYSKDMVCAGEMPIDNLFKMSDLITLYIKGGDLNEVETYENNADADIQDEQEITEALPDENS